MVSVKREKKYYNSKDDRPPSRSKNPKRKKGKFKKYNTRTFRAQLRKRVYAVSPKGLEEIKKKLLESKLYFEERRRKETEKLQEAELTKIKYYSLRINDISFALAYVNIRMKNVRKVYKTIMNQTIYRAFVIKALEEIPYGMVNKVAKAVLSENFDSIRDEYKADVIAFLNRNR